MQIISPPLKWHGGKHYLAQRIVALMPQHLCYVEPYFGGGAVMLAKDPKGISEVANDINGELTNFWQVLQQPDTFAQFQRRIEATPFSEVEFQQSCILNAENRIDQAVLFFIRTRQSLAGRAQSFAPISRNRTRRGMNEQVSAWLTAVQGLPAVHQRLMRVCILNKDALAIIAQMDTPHTLFYCDPPYLPSTRSSPDVYSHEMTEADHQQLLNQLARCKGKFILSGYSSPLYDYAQALHNWSRMDFDLPNNAAGGDTKTRMTETVWTNFPMHGGVAGIPEGQ